MKTFTHVSRQLIASSMVFLLSSMSAIASTKRICQLTVVQDRSSPGALTGMQLSGITGGVTGTDIGWSFEHQGRLHFLFGDTRNFSPDLCEPGPCGVESVQ